MYQRLKTGFFSGNMLKMLALITMTIDHVGAYLLTDMRILRIIGRLAFPIFAFMLAEGCRYTRNRAKYLLILGCTALVVQVAAFAVTGYLKQTVLVTFFMSAVLCFSFDLLIRKKNVLNMVLTLVGVGLTFVIAEILPELLKEYAFSVDYRFLGVLFPVAVFVAPRKSDKLLAATAMCMLLAVYFGRTQWYALASIPFLAFYNGQRGYRGMKYFYYIYFPAHLIVIWCIGMIMGA